QTTAVAMSSADVPPASQNMTVTNTTRLSPLQAGIDLRPGFLLQPGTLLYSRVGIAISRLSLDSNTSNTGDNFNQTWSVPLALSASKTVAGLRLGAGIEQSISSRFNL